AGRRDLVSAIIGLTLLKAEIVNNVALLPFISPAEDEPIWNKYLWQRYIDTDGVTEKWFTSPWLYVECYIYVLKFYDPFRTQKETLLEESMTNIMILGKYVEEVRQEFDIEEAKEKILYGYLQQFLKISLWGNHFDLSLPVQGDDDDVNTPLQNLDKLDNHIVVNDLEKVWNILNIVNDNAGYELFCDLCLADFLCFSDLVNKINFHVKAIPWFISDATIHDFNWLLHILESSNVSSSLPILAARWRNYLDSGRWQINNEIFWTLPHTYNEMKTWDEQLYNFLSNAILAIFKGDVNYRKLLAEKNWPSTETFNTALQGFNPTDLLSLRTVKSELICGMQPDQAEKLTDEIPNWMLSGDYGVIQFDESKKYLNVIE
ncbi:Protein-glutamate O-methyltransferase, partial [Blattella germanica]